MRHCLIAPAVAIVLLQSFTASPVLAAAGSNVLAQAGGANRAIDACAASKQGQALIDCVGEALSSFSSAVNRGEVPAKAPEILTVTAQAAEVSGKPKADALRVLNRVISAARGLATKSATDFQPAYNAVAGVFSRALGAIERKG